MILGRLMSTVPLGVLAVVCVTCLGALTTAPASARQLTGSAVSPAVSSSLATFDAAWAAIRETYVDQSRTDADWERLHKEFRARAAAAATDDELRPILRELLTALGRSHFELLPAGAYERSNVGSFNLADAGDLGFEVTPLDGEIVVTRVDRDSPSYAAGIRPGWVLDGIDGAAVRHLAGTGAAKGNRAQSFRNWAAVTALLKGPVDSRARLELRDAQDAIVTLDVPRARQNGQPVKFGHLPTLFARLDQRTLMAPGGGRVQYIHFNIWMTAIGPEIDRAVAAAAGADGVIVDLRQNPGGVLTMLMGVSGHFLSDPISLGTMRTRESELKLVANPRTVAAGGSLVRPYAGKLAIVVDESSYSASEIFAAGMQSIGRARIFGSRSPGGALPAMLRQLPNGDVLEYAIGDFVTATGEHIEGRGVIPDVEAPLTRAAARAGDDPPIAAAIAWIGESDSNVGARENREQ
jgi:carboxyl-terminal processing protease